MGLRNLVKTAAKVGRRVARASGVNRWTAPGAAASVAYIAKKIREDAAVQRKKNTKVVMAPLPQKKVKGRGIAYLGGRYGPKRFKKNKSKYYKSSKNTSVFNSYSGVFEHSGEVSDLNCVSVGHCTHPLWTLAVSTVCSIYAQLFNRIHRPVQRWSDLHGQPTTWGVKIEYTDDTGTDRIVDIYFNAAQTHYQFCERVMVYMLNAFNTNSCAGGTINLMQFFTSAGTNLEGAVQLRGATITSVGKSSLKYQNRTAANAGDDESDLNNQPLTGRIYERNHGFVQFRDKRGQLYSHGSSGRILGIAAGNDYLKEPVDNWVVEGSGSAVPIRIDPGKIKTSTIFKTIKVRVDKLFNEVCKISRSTGDFSLYDNANIFGKLRFMMLERVINVGNIGILGAYEIDSKLYTKVNTKKVLIDRHYQEIKG